MGFLPGYGYFAQVAAALQWDAEAIDLGRDAAAWGSMAPSARRRLSVLLAGFCVGEASVANELEPFAIATLDEQAAACFRLQAVDEARHARFFDRVAAEVAEVPGAGASERRDAMRSALMPEFVELFEVRLPSVARELAADADGLAEAVALYHLVLEGVVFSAGQLSMLELLEDVRTLPGVSEGVARVLRDERWHIGFGARALGLIGASPEALDHLLEEAAPALAAWGDAVASPVRARVLETHRRRLRAAGLVAQEVVT